MEYLREQIERKLPAVLVVLGNVVLRVVSGDAGAEVKNLRGRQLRLLGRPAVTGYHPLAARRRPNLFPLLVEDLSRARELLAQPDINL